MSDFLFWSKEESDPKWQIAVSYVRPRLNSDFIQQSDYYLTGELLENATFCCLFHEITLRTVRDKPDFACQTEISRSPIRKFIHITMQMICKWQTTFWAIQIFRELVFYLIFQSTCNWISSNIHHLICWLSWLSTKMACSLCKFL
jgi:hypothetical protein